MYFSEPRLEKIFSQAKLIIFDMNGLIVDDEKIQLLAFNKVLRKYNLEINEKFWINKCVGHKEADNFRKIFSLNKLQKTDKEIKRIIKKQKNIYGKIVQPQIKKIVRKGVLEIIKYIKNQTDKKLGLATSSTQEGCQLILGQKGLKIKNKFDFIATGDRVKKSKPHPEIYLKVKKYFGIKAKNCLVFEDSSPGVKAAKKAKMICLAVPSRYTKSQNFSQADFVITNLSPKAKVIIQV